MLSIVIPSHRRFDLLHACLTAVTRHAPPGTEIVVVDDASPEGQVSTVAATFGKVRILRLEVQSGFARAANAGIRLSKGQFVELLNDDTEVQAGWAESALACFADPAVASVAPLVLFWPDGQRIDSAGDRYSLAGVAGKRHHGEPVRADLKAGDVFGASASSGFYRRSALERVGLFPDDFGSYFEDVDLALRLRRAGFRAWFEPGSRVLHHVSASYGRVGRRLIQRQSRNEERVFWRNLPSPVLRGVLGPHAVVLLGKAWRRWQEGTLTPWLFGRLRLLWEYRALREHRRALGRITVSEDVATWKLDNPLPWRAGSVCDQNPPVANAPGSPSRV